MGMRIGGNNPNRRVVTLKKADGTAVGTISVSKPGNAGSTKKKKRLQYNFKEISTQILMTKTSGGASRIVSKARAKVAMLQRKLNNGNYDEKELELAIAHAKKMVRVAKKRVNHLKEEEKARQNGGSRLEIDMEEMDDMDDMEMMQDAGESSAQGLGKEELEELMREYRELMEESMEDLEDSMGDMTDLEELADEFLGVVREDVEPEDLEQLKKKHRADELREIVEADMKYLRALFDKLAKEKQESSGSGGVSLQIAGMEMPVETVEAPVVTEGGNVDVSL